MLLVAGGLAASARPSAPRDPRHAPVRASATHPGRPASQPTAHRGLGPHRVRHAALPSAHGPANCLVDEWRNPRAARASRDRERRRRTPRRSPDDDAGRAPGSPPRPPRVRALRASPLDPRPGQGPGPRGHGRVDREHRPRLARRPRTPRAAVPRARADLRDRVRCRRAARNGVVDQRPLRAVDR